jgi:hypothetical protein
MKDDKSVNFILAPSHHVIEMNEIENEQIKKYAVMLYPRTPRLHHPAIFTADVFDRPPGGTVRAVTFHTCQI